MTEIEYVIEQVKAALSEIPDVDIVDAYPNSGMKAHSRPVICVGLRQGESVSAGFAEYLGVFQDEQTSQSIEVYGKRMCFTVSTDIYSPKDAENGGKKCMEIFTHIVQKAGNFPKSMRADQILCGETEYDKSTGMFLCKAQIKLNVCLYAGRTEENEVLDFRLRGVMK